MPPGKSWKVHHLFLDKPAVLTFIRSLKTFKAIITDVLELLSAKIVQRDSSKMTEENSKLTPFFQSFLFPFFSKCMWIHFYVPGHHMYCFF